MTRYHFDTCASYSKWQRGATSPAIWVVAFPSRGTDVESREPNVQSSAVQHDAHSRTATRPHDSAATFLADSHRAFPTETGQPTPKRDWRPRSGPRTHATKTENMITPGSEFARNDTISSLIAALGNRDGLARHRARTELVERGHESVGELIGALKHPQKKVRWEAAKALVAIADPSATTALAEALTDDDGDVRWLAAEGMIAIGRTSVWPLLQLLTQRGDSVKLRQAAHHVLHTHFDDDLDESLAPVLEALDGPSPETAVPVEAYRVLRGGGHGDLPPDGDDGVIGSD
jgi:hypothetical protein